MEIETKDGDKGEETFHFDGSLLDTVENIHQEMLDNCPVKDNLTRSVLDRLVVDMLQHQSRPHAKFVFERSKRLIKDAEKTYGVSVVGLVGNANGELIDSNEARIGTRSPRQVSGEYHHSRAEKQLPPEQPLPPDEDSTLSPVSSRSQSFPQRHHHKSSSQTSNPRNNGAIETLHSGGQGSHVVLNPPPSPSAAANTYVSSPQQHLQQRSEKPMRPTLSIDEGQAWKEKRKRREFFELRGDENLTYLDQREHVSLVFCRLRSPLTNDLRSFWSTLRPR